MPIRISRFLLITLVAALSGCTLPGAVSPTPFVFPTPNMTHTAIFAATPSETPPPPTLPPVDATETVEVGAPTATSTAEAALPTATSSTLSSRPNGTPITAAYFSSPPAIDGDLSDWTTTPYTANEIMPYADDDWSGASDLSATFYIGWDETYLYLGVRRTDDKFVQISWGRYMYRGDDVEIQLDADLAGDYYTAAMSNDDYQIGVSPGDFDSIAPEAYRWYPRYLESWITAAEVDATKTNGGYELEARIPWSAMSVTPIAGGRYGFALSLSDNDVAGSSTFQSMVSSVSTRELADPTTWGTLILETPSGK